MKKIILTGLLSAMITVFAFGQELSHADQKLVKSELRKMLEGDQKYRTFISYGTLNQKIIDSVGGLTNKEQMNYLVSNKQKLGKELSDSLWVLQNKIDLENIIALEKIVKKHGWPSDERLSENISAEVLLFHTPTQKIEALEKLLFEEVKGHRMDPNQYGMFVDNMRLKHGKNQLYGTNAEFSRELMQKMPPTIDNIEATNKARKEIGLDVLKEGEYRTTK